MSADTKGKEMVYIDEGEEGELSAFERGLRRSLAKDKKAGEAPKDEKKEEPEKKS